MQLDYKILHIILFLNYNLLQTETLLISAIIILALLIFAAIILTLLFLALLILAMFNSVASSYLSNCLISSHFHKFNYVL